MHDLDVQTLTLPVSPERDHILGPPRARAVLVEYGDFECPHCGQAHYILQDLMARAGDHVRLVYRHFPLSQIHPHAARAAEASEAADAQGKFWEMHDLLFENQDALEDEDLVDYATELGLDLERFQTDLATSKYAERVREDFLSGVRSGVNGTPTFYINGHRHDGPWDQDSLMSAIQMSEHARQQHDGDAYDTQGMTVEPQTRGGLERTRNMTTSSLTISSTTWPQYFQNIAKTYGGWAVTMELLAGKAGDQRRVDGLPFQGISYEVAGSQAGDIIVETGDAGTPFETHLIRHPRMVRVAQTQPGAELDIAIEDEEGVTTLIELRPRPALPPARASETSGLSNPTA